MTKKIKKAADKKTPKKRAPKKARSSASAKKSAKKQPAKTRTSSDTAVQKQIEEAVARIPSMLTQETPRQSQAARYAQQYHHEHTAQRRILWIGVSIITVLICVMWVLNVRSAIDTVYNSSTDDTLLTNTHTDFKTLLEQLEPKDSLTLQEVITQEFATNPVRIRKTITGTIAMLIEHQVIATSTNPEPNVTTIEEEIVEQNEQPQE